MMASIDLAGSLRTVLGATEVSDPVRLSGGASRETFRFVADGRPLILQRQRRGSEQDMGLEAAVLRAARRGGVPVAEVLAADTDPSVLGAPFMVLSAVDGETIARKLLRDAEYAGARASFATQAADALARLHSIDPAEAPGLADTDQVARFREVLDVLGQPHPTFELVFRWLEANRPPASPPAIVHGDFRLGNLIIGTDGLRAVIDWELAHLGDPAEDLGWLCVKAWRFGAAPPVAGMGEYTALLDAYRAAGGRAIDRETLRWWEVLGTLKWGVMCIMQANSHLAGFSRSHELAAIGRRVCENEYDLFVALEGAW